MGGSKGQATYDPQHYDRPVTEQELALFRRQNEMMDAGLAIAQAQQARANQMQNDYDNGFRHIVTGITQPGASRDNGYMGAALFTPEAWHNGMADSFPSIYTETRGDSGYYAPHGQTPYSIPSVQEATPIDTPTTQQTEEENNIINDTVIDNEGWLSILARRYPELYGKYRS